MTGRKLFFILSSFLLFGSCQKSVDWTAPILTTDSTGTGGGGNTGGTTTGDLLVKAVAVSGTDSYTTLYTYDAAKRLITEDLKGTASGFVLDTYKKFYRDANGRIYKTAQLIKQPGIPVDTSFTDVYYPNATTLNFTYTISTITVAGMGSVDSSVYVWDANGKVVSHSSFMSSTFMPGVIMSKTKSEYIYANGNLTQHKQYAELSPGAALSLVSTTNYTFDNYTNPLVTNGEFILTGKADGASKNNVTKMEIIDVTTPSNSRTLLTTLSYGTGNKPTGGTVTMLPQNTVTKFTFYYQ